MARRARIAEVERDARDRRGDGRHKHQITSFMCCYCDPPSPAESLPASPTCSLK